MSSFLKVDTPKRQPIGRRFSEFLMSNGNEELSVVASFEAALTYSPAPDDRWHRPPGNDSMKLLHLSQNIDLLAADFDFVRLTDMLRQGRPGQPVRKATHVAVGRNEDGDSFIAEMPPQLFTELSFLKSGARPRNEVRITAQELATLKECGILEEV